MKKILLFISVFVLVLIALYFAWESYQSSSIQRQTSASHQYWSDALDVARQKNITTDEFVEKFGSRGEIVKQEPGSVHLRETIELDNLLYSAWQINIYFSWSGGDSARSSLMLGSGVRQ